MWSREGVAEKNETGRKKAADAGPSNDRPRVFSLFDFFRFFRPTQPCRAVSDGWVWSGEGFAENNEKRRKRAADAGPSNDRPKVFSLFDFFRFFRPTQPCSAVSDGWVWSEGGVAETDESGRQGQRMLARIADPKGRNPHRHAVLNSLRSRYRRAGWKRGRRSDVRAGDAGRA